MPSDHNTEHKKQSNLLKKIWLKPYEFWHPRIFELPFYFYLATQCLINRLRVADLAKANSALDHGEIGIGSKFHTQLQFDQQLFLPTSCLAEDLSVIDKRQAIEYFAAEHGYPVILKPDIGMVGKGIIKISAADELDSCVDKLAGVYILQKFTPYQFEAGIFYVRQNGKAKITGINQKHFPTVVGNGSDSLLTLAQNHYRYSHHWSTFLRYFDTDRVPVNGEEICLSFIGSHTMGCKFTDDSEWLTAEIETAVFSIFNNQPDFNFGRLDVKCQDKAALQRGEFVVIEVNGVSSLPTHMFDPKYSVFDAYRIFFEHGKYLAQIASENRHKAMELMSLRQILNKVKLSQNLLDKTHSELKSQQS